MLHSLTAMALLITVVLLLGLTATAWRFRDKPAAKAFGVLQALSAVWASLALVGLQLPTGPLRLQLWGLNTGVSLVVVVFWLAFILEYTGRDYLITPSRLGLASLPLAIGAALYFVAPSWPPLVGQVSQTTITAGSIVQASVGPVGGMLGVYIYLVFLVGLGLVVKSIAEGNSLFVGQGIAFVLGTLVTVIASFLGIVGIPVSGYPVTEVALGSQSLLWGYAVFGQQFLQAVPAVAAVGERVVFNDIDAAIIVVDTEGMITRMNPAACSYLDIEGVGKPMTRILTRMGVSALSELPTRFQSGGQTYRAETSAITNWRGESIGQAVVIQDVTALVRRQQRLQVLTRILRHNVRNDMNVVLGMGDRLQQRHDDELTKMGETIYQRADDMISISNKAIEIDRIFDEKPAVDTLDVETSIEEIVSSLATQYPDATISTDIVAAELRTDSRILTLVVEEILTNALEHAGDTPEITVDATERDDHLEITVTDDGPGIPQTEIEPITAGEETDLEHASSLGLWLVYWGTQSLGGDVDFTTSDEGSTVTLSLPEMRTNDTPAPTQSDGNGTTYA